jgi:hypothetical protein
MRTTRNGSFPYENDEFDIRLSSLATLMTCPPPISISGS